jgi:hypothetical protein
LHCVRQGNSVGLYQRGQSSVAGSNVSFKSSHYCGMENGQKGQRETSKETVTNIHVRWHWLEGGWWEVMRPACKQTASRVKCSNEQTLCANRCVGSTLESLRRPVWMTWWTMSLQRTLKLAPEAALTT